MPVPPERIRMVEQRLRGRDIVDARVLEAMERVPRELFVPDDLKDRAFDDAALPIGAGQTISQPYMVARIAEELGLDGDEQVLDVGTVPATRPRFWPSSRTRCTRSSGSPSWPSGRERVSRPPATTTSTFTWATARGACPSTRPTT